MDNDDLKIFVQKKRLECEQLIKYRIWDGIDSNNFKSWLKNFITPEEKYFAALVLEWLVYRTDNHCKSMLYDVISRQLHNQLRLDKNPIYDIRQNPLKLLQEKYNDPKIRYVTAVTKEDPGSKSGYSMVRLLNNKLQTSTKWNISNEQIESAYNDGIRTYIYVDDIIGNGEQICGVLNESSIIKYDDVYIYVCVCAAHEKGLAMIKEKYPHVKVLASEFISNNTDIFANIYGVLGYDNRDELREWYKAFMKIKGVKDEHNIYGRGDLGLVYAFQDNTPNNSLPILHFYNEKLSRLLNKRG